MEWEINEIIIIISLQCNQIESGVFLRRTAKRDKVIFLADLSFPKTVHMETMFSINLTIEFLSYY